MTECERLIEEGKLDNGFLKDEIRCGIDIPIKTKKLWALQIDLMKQIEALCKKHNLTCYLVGGGCIGAIRHKGYIPWDDDVDVALKREDYDIFVEKAQTELKEPYFLQTPITDPLFYRPFVVLRNSNGTCISKGDQKLKCNNGILIHIFPLDGYEDNLECNLFRKISFYKNYVAYLSYNAFSTNRHQLRKMLLYISRFIVFPLGVKHYYRKFNEKCSKLSKKYTKKIGVQYTHFTNPCLMGDAKHFEETIDVPFEYTTLPVPKGYHEILVETYGDYMQFPPEEQRVNKHGFEYDPDTPYKEYCEEKYGVKYSGR